VNYSFNYCLLVSYVKFGYWAGLWDAEYGHAFICALKVLINSQYHIYANNQLLNTKNWTLN